MHNNFISNNLTFAPYVYSISSVLICVTTASMNKDGTLACENVFLMTSALTRFLVKQATTSY